MASEWVDMEQDGAGLVVMDAMGAVIDSVEAFRLTPEGVEVIALAITPEGNELLCSYDGGVTLEPIRARMDIPGGMVVDLNEEE
jgi:hypothetical protein